MALCGQMPKENGKKTPQAKACGAIQMVLKTTTGHHWRLEQTRAVYTDTEKKLAEYTGQSREVIRRLLIEAGTEALLADDTIHRQAGKRTHRLRTNPASC